MKRRTAEERSTRPKKRERILLSDELPISSLPCELLQYIFSFLDFKNLIRAQLVCATWNQVLYDDYVWKGLYLREFGGPLPDQTNGSSLISSDSPATLSWRTHAIHTYKEWLHWSVAERKVDTLAWALSHKHARLALEQISTMPAPSLNERIATSTWEQQAQSMWNAIFNDDTFSPNTVLDVASGYGLLPVVEALLQRGAHPDGIAHRNKDVTIQRVMSRQEPMGLATPLLLAAKAGHLEIVELLLSHGARKGDEDWKSFAALHQILRVMYPSPERQPYAVMLAWRHGFMNRSALAAAVSGGHTQIAESLLKSGSDVSFLDMHMNGLMHMAAKARNEEMVAILLSFIKEKTGQWDLINLENENHTTPLEIATKTGELGVVRRLLEAGADAKHVREKKGVLQIAIERQLWDIATLLLAHGASPNNTLMGRTPMQLAISIAGDGAYDFVCTLFNSGAVLPSSGDRAKQKNSELYRAIRYRKNKELADRVASFLIKKGADASVIEAMTAVHLKEELRRRGLAEDGNKQVLMARLLKYITEKDTVDAVARREAEEDSQETRNTRTRKRTKEEEEERDRGRDRSIPEERRGVKRKELEVCRCGDGGCGHAGGEREGSVAELLDSTEQLGTGALLGQEPKKVMRKAKRRRRGAKAGVA